MAPRLFLLFGISMRRLFNIAVTSHHPSVSGAVVVLAALLVFAGCGEIEEGEPGPSWGQSDTEDVGEPDAGNDVDDQPDAEPPDQNDDDNSPPGHLMCGDTAQDLGVLEGGSKEIEVDFTDFTDNTSSGCDGVVDESSAAVFELILADEGILRVESDEVVARAIRHQGCRENDTLLVCDDQDFGRQLVPGESFFVIFEKLPETPEQFEATLDFTAFEACDPEEHQSQCVDETSIESCITTSTSPDIPRTLVFPCPAGCSDDACDGASCDNPVTVSGSTTIDGTTVAVGDHINSSEQDSCVPEDAVGNLEGRDLVVHLEGLEEGDVVDIELESSHDELAVIEIKADCSSDAQCLEAWRGEGDFQFHPPDDGDYFLIMDSEVGYEAGFELDIDIN